MKIKIALITSIMASVAYDRWRVKIGFYRRGTYKLIGKVQEICRRGTYKLLGKVQEICRRGICKLFGKVQEIHRRGIYKLFVL